MTGHAYIEHKKERMFQRLNVSIISIWQIAVFSQYKDAPPDKLDVNDMMGGARAKQDTEEMILVWERLIWLSHEAVTVRELYVSVPVQLIITSPEYSVREKQSWRESMEVSVKVLT